MLIFNRFFLFFVIGLIVLSAGLWISGGKEERFSAAIEMDAAPSQVFPYLTEPQLLTQWVTGLEQIDRLTPPPEPPSMPPEIVRLVVDEKGNKNYYSDYVIRYSQDSMISLRSSKGGVVYTLVYQLKPGERGRTRFESFVIVSFSGLARLMAPFQGTNLEDQMIAEARRLKELVEKNEEFIELEEDLTAQPDENDLVPEESFFEFDKVDQETQRNEEPEYRVPGFGSRESTAPGSLLKPAINFS